MKKSTLYSCIAALLLAIIALLFFAPDDLQGNVLQQHDIMQGLANGHETQQYEAETGHASRWTNALFSGMPTFQISPSYAANSVLGKVFSLYTLWLPSPANLLFAMMLGFFIMALCMKFRWPTALFAALAWGFSTYFIIIIGAGHIWKFLTLAYIPPTIGGLALIFRRKYLSGTALTALFGALQLQSNHPQMTYYFLFPIFFMVIARGLTVWREHEMKGWFMGLGCACVAAILALGANSASLYNSYEYSKETIRGRSTELTTDNAPEASGADHDYITAWSYGIDETWSLLIPNVKGGATIKPTAGQSRTLSVADAAADAGIYVNPDEAQLLQNFPQYFGDQPMTNGPVYVGAIVLLLAILAMFVVDGKIEGPMKWALFISIIFSIFLSWGHNFAALTDFFIDHFPEYNKFRTPASILVVLEFCVPLLAAMALRKMVTTPDFLDRYKWTFYTVFGGGVLVCLFGWLFPSIFGQPFSMAEVEQLKQLGIFNDPAYSNLLNIIRDTRLHLVSADSARSLMYIIIGGLIIWLYLRGAFRQKTLFVGALCAVMVIDLFSVNKRYVDSENFTTPAEPTESFAESEADRMILQDSAYYRVADLADPNGARSSYFHHTVGGYHAAKLTRYNDLLTHIIQPATDHLVKEAQTNYERLAADSTAMANPDSLRLFTSDVPVLDMLNTKYYLMGDYAEENPNALGNAWFVGKIDYVDNANAEMEALAQISPATTAVADAKFKSILGEASAPAPGDTIRLTSYAPDRLTYAANSTRGGIAVFSEVFFPWGWEATIDGKPAEIGRVDYTLRALRIPAGKHEVVMIFNPRSLDVTNTLGIIAVALIFIICACALAKWIIQLRKLHKNEAV